MSDQTALVRMATSKPFSLLTTKQLNAGGYDRLHIRDLVKRGLLHGVRRGLYTTSSTPSWTQTLGATYLHVGHEAVVSHRSAVRLHGLRKDDDVDLTIRYPADSHAKGVSVHRSRDLTAADLVVIDDFPATSATRTLCDLGLVLPPCDVERLMDHSIATGPIVPTNLLQLRVRVGEHGRTGVGMVDTAIGDLPEFARLTESGPELRLYKIITRSTVPNPTPQVPVRAHGHQYYVDLGYSDLRIALEYDGTEHHSTPEQLEHDRRRQRHLEAIGWSVIRYEWADLEDIHVPRTLKRISDAIRQRNPDL